MRSKFIIALLSREKVYRIPTMEGRAGRQEVARPTASLGLILEEASKKLQVLGEELERFHAGERGPVAAEHAVLELDGGVRLASLGHLLSDLADDSAEASLCDLGLLILEKHLGHLRLVHLLEIIQGRSPVDKISHRFHAF